MALTPEMQAQVDMNAAMEEARAATQAAAQAKQVKLEMVRAAKEILVENRRTKAAADATDITASAVTALATDLTAFVNS
jgi:hypothetical protein